MYDVNVLNIFCLFFVVRAITYEYGTYIHKCISKYVVGKMLSSSENSRFSTTFPQTQLTAFVNVAAAVCASMRACCGASRDLLKCI